MRPIEVLFDEAVTHIRTHSIYTQNTFYIYAEHI
jgi:hypothetical protein